MQGSRSSRSSALSGAAPRSGGSRARRLPPPGPPHTSVASLITSIEYRYDLQLLRRAQLRAPGALVLEALGEPRSQGPAGEVLDDPGAGAFLQDRLHAAVF